MERNKNGYICKGVDTMFQVRAKYIFKHIPGSGEKRLPPKRNTIEGWPGYYWVEFRLLLEKRALQIAFMYKNFKQQWKLANKGNVSMSGIFLAS